VSRRQGPEAAATEKDELERLCDELGRVEAPFDEVARSRAEARLGAALAREPAWRHRRALAWTAALVAVGAAAAVALVAGTVVPAVRSYVAGRPAPSLRFEPYVVAPTDAAAAAAVVPEALMQPASRLDVPAGWLVRASLGDAIAITLTGPARAWSERPENAGNKERTVVHLEAGRLLASLEGGDGRRLEIVSPGAVTDVVGTLFSVEVIGGGSRVAVVHGRVQVNAAATSADAQPRPPREIGAGESWLTTVPEPDGIEPALAADLADHERTPPPRGVTVPLSVTEAPAGAGIWVGNRRLASAPAWVLVEPHASVRLSMAARAGATSSLPAPPSTDPSPPLSEPPARATRPASPRPLLPPPTGEPTERSPLDPAPLAPEEVTARTLFRQADAARAAGDTGLALNTLRALVERFPRDPATAAARYELALMEQAAADGEAALRDLAAVDAPSLEDPSHYLRCRVLATRSAAQGAEAERCLAEFRRRFPGSAHEADALATETALALARGGCPAAHALLAELERRHPTHRSAARLRAACPPRP
jgi:hypothetical protein